MNILVTGGAGYIGRRLVREAVKEHEVYVLDIATDYEDMPYAPPDITSPKDVADWMVGMDAVIHLAALRLEACTEDTRRAYEVNVVGTQIVVEEAKRAGVKRLVFASTGSVYGKSDRPATESSLVYPLSFYAETKLMGEEIVVDAGYVTVRFGTVYGVSPNMRWDLLPHTIAKTIAEGKGFKLYGPEAHRPITHIEDAVSALLEIVSREPNAALTGKIFNVVTANVQKERLADEISCRGRYGPGHVEYCYEKEDKRDYQMDGCLIEKTIGWRPRGEFGKELERIMRLAEQKYAN